MVLLHSIKTAQLTIIHVLTILVCLNLVPRVLVTLVQRWSGQHDRDSRTSGSTAHVFDPMFQLTDAKILGLPVLLRRSGGSLHASQRSLLAAPPLDNGNEDSGNEIEFASFSVRDFLFSNRRKTAAAYATVAINFTSYKPV